MTLHALHNICMRLLAAERSGTPQLFAPDGKFEYVPFYFFQLLEEDLAALGRAVAQLDRHCHRSDKTGVVVSGRWHNGEHAARSLAGLLRHARPRDDVAARIGSDVAAELGRPVMVTGVARQWSSTFIAEDEAAFGACR